MHRAFNPLYVSPVIETIPHEQLVRRQGQVNNTALIHTCIPTFAQPRPLFSLIVAPIFNKHSDGMLKPLLSVTSGGAFGCCHNHRRTALGLCCRTWPWVPAPQSPTSELPVLYPHSPTAAPKGMRAAFPTTTHLHHPQGLPLCLCDATPLLGAIRAWSW